MTTRKYSSRSQQTTLAANLTDSATSCTVVSGSALLGGASVTAGTTFTVVIDPDTALEEIVDVTIVSTNVLTITRGVENDGIGQAHSAGAAVRHMAIGRDFREANLHIEATGGYNDGSGPHTMHGIAAGEGVVVGTDKIQTLTQKTLTSPIITNPSISGAGVDASIVFEGATPDAFETTLTVVDPTQDNTITMPNTTGTVVLANAAQTLTNKTIDMTGVTLTGLSSAGMSVSSATPKNYVDSILGSATSAATSAASAATSATSAATSAGSAETSAIASAASASTSATSAASATTSASSAATSAASALTSANSASASAITAAASVATIAAAATAATNAASAAATSATSASASATAAATSATSASASATAAATSASSAAASAASIVGDAAAAATSAASASTSAASASTSASSALTSANSASADATTAAASVAAIAGYASAASTSATSADASATAAATSASSASTSASSALTSATSAATSYDEFDDRYLGAKASPPSTDNDGNALLTGALYWNTSSNKMFVWSGSAWAEISSSADIISYKYTVAGGATSVSGADDNGLTLAYTVGKEQVYINGVLQVRDSDYTASTGSSITGISAMLAGDIVTVLAFTAFVVADTYTQAQADAKFFQTANAFLAGKNKFINGDMGINQRGFTSGTTSASYPLDRFQMINVGGGDLTVSTQTFAADAPVAGYDFGTYIRLVTSGTGDAASAKIFRQKIENVATFANQTVTVSFYAKASTGTPSVAMSSRQIFGTGGSTLVETYVNKTAITSSWARYSFVYAVPSISGKTVGAGSNLEFQLWTSAGSNYNAVTNSLGTQNVTIDTWGWQVEAGSIATPFQTATGTIAGELAACQRYYQKTYSQPTAPATTTSDGSMNGVNSGTTLIIALGRFPVVMRTAPTITLYSSATGTTGQVRTGGADVAATVANVGDGGIGYLSATGLTAGGNSTIHYAASAEI